MLLSNPDATLCNGVHSACAVSDLTMAKLWLLSSGLVFLAWLINENIPPRRPPILNWDSSVFFNPDSDGLWLLPNASLGYPQPVLYPSNILQPSSKEEIAHMIKSALVPSSEDASAIGHPKRIRVIGSGHSWSKIAQSDGLQMSLESYKGLVRIDRELNQVIVKGGTTFKELNSILEQQGLAMTMLGSISEQTVAGAISTGTHGTGINVGNLATMVTALELVTGKGDILTLTANKNPEMFKAAQVSLGLLGVISEVTFQCEPSFNLKEVAKTVPMSICLDKIATIATNNAPHVKMWVEFHSGTCGLFEISRTTEAPRDNPNHKVETVVNYVFELIAAVGSWLPSYAHSIFSSIFSVLDIVEPHDRVDVSHRIFNIPHYFPVHHEGELVFSSDDCAAAVRDLQKMVLEEEVPLNYIVEVRFVKGDDIWLSPNYQRNSCHLTLCIYNPSAETLHHYLYGSFKTLAKFNPRVHWGKYFNLSPSEIGKMYPKFKDFMKIRSELDPSGLFLNEQLASTFGLKHLL